MCPWQKYSLVGGGRGCANSRGPDEMQQNGASDQSTLFTKHPTFFCFVLFCFLHTNRILLVKLVF